VYLEHLRVCDDCWTAWLVWRSLDPEGAAQPGDEEIAARAADRTLRALRREAPGVRRTARAAAAVVLLAGTMASAAVYQYRRWTARGGEAPATTSNGAAARSARARGPASVEHAAIAMGPERTAAALPPAPIAHRAARPEASDLGDRRHVAPAPGDPASLTPAPFAPPASPVTAAVLFAEATDLRRSGRSAGALAAFQRLQAEFPGSAEATVSLISEAEMLADASRPAAALALFEAYLATAPAGSLYPEALRGKARALERLGRGSEAQSVRRELGHRMPGSLYVPER
jgi:TolA-binding protein